MKNPFPEPCFTQKYDQQINHRRTSQIRIPESRKGGLPVGSHRGNVDDVDEAEAVDDLPQLAGAVGSWDVGAGSAVAAVVVDATGAAWIEVTAMNVVRSIRETCC